MECAAYGSKRDKLPAPKERAGQVAAFATKRSRPPGTWNGLGASGTVTGAESR